MTVAEIVKSVPTSPRVVALVDSPSQKKSLGAIGESGVSTVGGSVTIGTWVGVGMIVAVAVGAGVDVAVGVGSTVGCGVETGSGTAVASGVTGTTVVGVGDVTTTGSSVGEAAIAVSTGVPSGVGSISAGISEDTCFGVRVEVGIGAPSVRGLSRAGLEISISSTLAGSNPTKTSPSSSVNL